MGPAHQEGAKLPQGKPDTERRDSVRHRCTQPVTISEEGASGAERSGWQGTVSNISHNGLAMVLHRRLQTGTVVTIQPVQLTQAKPMRSKVVHVSQHHRGWFTGLEFATPLSEKELLEWLK